MPDARGPHSNYTKENKMIGVGSVVEIYDCDLEEISSFTIVSKQTGKEKEISFDCALGKALLGKLTSPSIAGLGEDHH